jgi:hypothetical protein
MYHGQENTIFQRANTCCKNTPKMQPYPFQAIFHHCPRHKDKPQTRIPQAGFTSEQKSRDFSTLLCSYSYSLVYNDGGGGGCNQKMLDVV